MSAIVTDQFRINNAGNFLGNVNTSENSYYVFVGLSNPTAAATRSSVAFGRNASLTDWNDDATRKKPIDNFNYLSHVKDTMIFGKKITSDNIRRVVRKIEWTKETRYDMYRHDYSKDNMAPNGKTARLYDSNYYVINKDFNVYICISNGSSGINTEGNRSLNEPSLTGLEPFRASGASDDGYLWKYLFTISPSDIIKFDATEYIPLPNDWSTSDDANISNVRDNANSDINNNQIKTVYIENQGSSYKNAGAGGQEFNIVGDGSGGKAIVEVGSDAKISDVKVSVGGKGYSYGIVDLTTIQPSNPDAKLIPIIPPSKGHGYNLYKELGADRILVYARFDDATKDFPIDTKFSQIGIVKNPTSIGSTEIFTQNQYSSVSSLYLDSFPDGTIEVGDLITQDVKSGSSVIGQVRGYVVSFDKISTDSGNPIAVLKYYRDRSLYFNTTTGDQSDHAGIGTISGSNGQVYDFTASGETISGTNGSTSYTVTINSNFSGITTNPTGTKVIDLGVEFKNGLSQSEINNQSGDIIYLDNRKSITRDSRQKEDIKVILEF
tara:strand:+ start:2195 stop:3844 length:1650 start_codon:yes stop_codon:yes gene_type:complete